MLSLLYDPREFKIMEIRISENVKEKFPDLIVKPFLITGVSVEERRNELEEFKHKISDEIKTDNTIKTIKDAPIIRRYRDFYWRAGIDPTKTRPASEALIRRVLKDKPIPKINTLVDTYNLASMKTNMALATFDAATIVGNLEMRMSTPGEKFLGIGMQKPLTLIGKEPIVTDEDKTIAVYPYRDSDETKITLKTMDTIILVCGVPGITPTMIDKTAALASEYITRFCGGTAEF
jgi:DNA/RNA-binding domain of Phe-tRNA-synthetase-like protein